MLVESKNINTVIDEIIDINIGHITINTQARNLHIRLSGYIHASQEVVRA